MIESNISDFIIKNNKTLLIIKVKNNRKNKL